MSFNVRVLFVVGGTTTKTPTKIIMTSQFSILNIMPIQFFAVGGTPATTSTKPPTPSIAAAPPPSAPPCFY